MSNQPNTPLQSGAVKSSLKQTVLFFVGGLLLGSTVASGFFLNRAKQQPALAASDVAGETLFKVDGSVYTVTSLPRAVQMNYFNLSNSIYDAKLNFTNQIALRMALAKDNPKVQATSTDDLPALEALLSVPDVQDAEVEQYYKSIAAQYGQAVFGGQTLAQLKPQLKQQMARQKTEQAVGAKLQEFTANGRITSFLVKPEAPAVELNLTGYPTRGSDNSVLTLVEVADYMCPHCRETEPAIEKLYKEFGDKVKFVHVSFPLNTEGLNGALARGAFCATQQGQAQFWNYHKNAFQVSWDKMNPADKNTAAKFFDDEAVAVATKSNLDMQAFNNCLASEDAKNYLTRLKNEFNASTGFKGTPTFYLNNKLVQANPAQLEETLRNTLKQVASR